MDSILSTAKAKESLDNSYFSEDFGKINVYFSKKNEIFLEEEDEFAKK